MKPRIAATVRRHLDRDLMAARAMEGVSMPRRGWVNAIRRALGMTERQLGERLGVAQSTVHRMEASEADGTVSLNTLRRAAEALDCTLVYALVPRRPLDQTIEERAHGLARRELSRVEQAMSLEAQAVSFSEDIVEERAREIRDEGNLWRDP